MPFQKGKSGNPKGRPPRGRALADILEKAGSKTIVVDGHRVSRRELMARMLWEIATTGEATLPGTDRTLVAGAGGWLDVVKFIYSHVDGPARPEPEPEETPKQGRIDLSKLSVEELDTLERILTRAAGAGAHSDP